MVPSPVLEYWNSLRSRNGLHGDELNAMLQKAIRRAEEKAALSAAYEMYITSPQYLEVLWMRLQVISVEDIGFGDPYAPRLIRTLYQMHLEFPYNDGDQPIFFTQAIRYLCRCKKERTSDHRRGMIKRAFRNGYIPVIPDYVHETEKADPIPEEWVSNK